MASQNLKSARQVAIEVLNQHDPKRNYAAAILNKLLVKTEQRQRATDLVFGSIRNRTALDTLVAKLSGRPVERIAARLLNILRIAAFELCYSPQTPEYSIVNEAVENTKAMGGRKQVGFVNAVLRQITRHIANRQANLTEANLTSTLPQTAATGCEFDPSKADLLPDPKALPADYLSAAFSLPTWLVTGWLGEFGAELTHQICLASNRRPSIYIRPNPLRISTQQLAEKLRQNNIEWQIAPDQSAIKIKSPQAVTELPGFGQGLFTVQDIAASQAVKTLAPQPGWTILDLCAAPGAKTTQLAEITGDSARIIATDIDSRRLQKVKENAARLGIKSLSIIPYENLERQAAEIGPFDAVLLDVPCSNTGVLAKRIEVRYRISLNAIKELTKTQRRLLAAAAKTIRPAGKICYSTCSIQKAENADLVRDFLTQNPDFKLESERLALPSAEEFDHDGAYVAIIERISTPPDLSHIP